MADKVTIINHLHVPMVTGTMDLRHITHVVMDPHRTTTTIETVIIMARPSDVDHPSITMDTTDQEMITTMAGHPMIIANIKDTASQPF